MSRRHKNYAPRGDRKATARQELVASFMEQFAQPEDPPQTSLEVIAPIMYPENISSTSEEIHHNATQIGRLYDTLLPERGMGEAFSATITEVADVLEQKSGDDDNELCFNALSELKLLTEVERLFIEKDFKHVEVLPFIDQEGKSQIVRAGLEGITVPLKATGTFPQGKTRGETYHVEARFATWRFDPTGIRLEIEYEDPVTGVLRTVQARMDFHYRKNPKFGDKKQAALDLDGGYLKEAIRTSNELGRDYHRYEHLDQVINSDADFSRVRLGRLQHASQVVAASGKKH